MEGEKSSCVFSFLEVDINMRTGYYNGEWVYVLKWPGHVHYDGFIEPRKVQIFRHRDLIHLLNRLFNRVAKADIKEMDRPLDIGFLMFCILSRFRDKGEWYLPFEAKDEEAFAFDDSQTIKKVRVARLRAGLKVFKGGFYSSAPAEPKPDDDGLSDDFRAFLRQERAKADHQGKESYEPRREDQGA